MSGIRALLVILLLSSRAMAIDATISQSVFCLADPIYPGKLDPIMETYWQVTPRSLHFATVEGKGIVAKMEVRLQIYDDTGKLFKDDFYIYQTTPKQTPAELNALNILELKRYFVKPGKLTVKIKLVDMNDTNNKYTNKFTVTVPKQPRTAFYSDVEFIDTVMDVSMRSPFQKHGHHFLPLVDGFYDNFRNKLSYFNEVYQLDTSGKMPFPLIQTTFISRKQGESPIYNLVKTDTIQRQSAFFNSGDFDITALSSGNYFLNFKLTTIAKEPVASKNVMFQRFNTKPQQEDFIPKKIVTKDTGIEKVNVVDLNKAFVSKYNMAQIRSMLKMIKPLLDESGARTVDGFMVKPDETYMRYFVYNYFKDKNSKNPEKEWKQYSDLVIKVNKMFSSQGIMGYETPRGFMYLRYGAPTEIVTKANDQDSHPYELWQYNTLTTRNGKIITDAFILFVKNNELDFDYMLLHSNIDGEYHNVGWRNFLFNNPRADHSNTVAEQMIGNK